MSMGMTCQDFEALSGAYALGAVTSDEHEEAGEHLGQCSDCRTMANALEGVVEWLPLAVPLVEPSEDLKGRMLTRINAQSGLEAADLPRSMRRQRRGMDGQQEKWGAWASRGWSRAFVAVAAVLLVLVMGGMVTWNVNLQQRVSVIPGVKPTAPMQVQALRYSMQGTGTAVGSSGQVTCYQKEGVCLLVMKGLSTLHGKQVYQGWLLQGKQSTSMGVLSMENGVGTVGFVGNGHSYDAAAVSREPGPAATQQAPKGPIVAQGSLH